MDLDDYQQQANRTDQLRGDDEPALVAPLVGLASEVGALLTQYKRRLRDGDAHRLFSERVAEELGDILWYVANISAKLDLQLSEVADRNLRKVFDRWPVDGDGEVPLVDERFPATERLPRQASVAFAETRDGQRAEVRLYVGYSQDKPKRCNRTR